MSKLQEIFSTYYSDYYDKFWNNMPFIHHKVATDIQRCQTGYFGATEIMCLDCEHTHNVMTGCGNRHCSGCQMSKGIVWGEKQAEKLLNGVSYFMVTFTIPEEARACFRSNQKECYDMLFKAGSAVVREMLSNKKNLGVDKLGYTGVFHPGGRTMNYHPHVHFIIPNGGMTKDYTEWKQGRVDYIFNVDSASKLFRGKMMDLLRNHIPQYPELESCRNKGWNVNAEQKGDGENSLKYLSRYLFKSAVAESNILSWSNGFVTFQYTPHDKKGKRNGEHKDGLKKKKMTLPVEEFFHRFLSLVLPKGFMKVRHYGFLGSNPKLSISEIRTLIDSETIEVINEEKPAKVSKTYLRCAKCNSKKIQMIFIPPSRRSLIKKE